MTFRTLTVCAFAFAVAASVPGAAQMAKDSMSSDSMKMSSSEMKTMRSCQKMSNDAMMNNSKCMAMIKIHPDMMNGDEEMMKK